MTSSSPLPAGMILRPGRDSDGPSVASLIAAIFAEYEDCPFVPDEFPELAAPATHFERHGGRLWVVQDEAGAIIGTIAVARRHREGEMELFKVYVAHGHRGRGLARLMLDEALALARAAGARRVVLWSDTRFHDGHRFYLRNGFRQLPGIRALHDLGRSMEFGFERAL
jgi:putative acetyltransferase